MEALVVRKLGDPTLPLSDEGAPATVRRDHPLPEIVGPTGVRVRVAATSLNYANYLQILGKYQEKPPLPFVPGSDYSGVVDAVGKGVTRLRVGDRVCSFANLGTFAEFVVAEERDLFLVPGGCDLVAAGAIPVAFGTSYAALIHRAHLKHGQVLLVLGAAGGVGLAAVQIGKVCGAVVIAVARGDEKSQLLQSQGADHVVDTNKENLIDSVRNFLKAKHLKGVNVLFDPVGGNSTKDSLKVLSWGASILIIGFASGEVPVIPANLALVKNWTIHGLYWGSYNMYDRRVIEDSVKEPLSWLSKGLISVQISHAFPLSQANEAFVALKERKVLGKVMLVMGENSTPRPKL